MRKSLPLALLLLFTLFLPATAGAAGKIQAKIDAAKDGEVIVIPPGEYKENIDFKGKAITLKSQKPDDPAVVAKTVIDGGGRGSVVTFRSGETNKSVLEGFTIRNGKADRGGGIYIESSAPTIKSNIITRNSALTGGGIALVNSVGARLENNLISENRAGALTK